MARRPTLTSSARRDLTGPALRTFFRIAETWSLSADEQARLLGLSDVRTLQRWRRGGVSRLSRDTLERISYVFGIFKAINMLLPRPERADAWMRAPNSAPLFRGRSALERMTAGNVGDLYAVRQYLDGEQACC